MRYSWCETCHEVKKNGCGNYQSEKKKNQKEKKLLIHGGLFFFPCKVSSFWPLFFHFFHFFSLFTDCFCLCEIRFVFYFFYSVVALMSLAICHWFLCASPWQVWGWVHVVSRWKRQQSARPSGAQTHKDTRRQHNPWRRRTLYLPPVRRGAYVE